MDIEVFLVPFELRPGMPEEGLSASRDGLGHSERVDDHLRRVAREEGAAMKLPDLIPKTHRALVMAEVARDAGPDVHWRTHMSIFGAYYGDGEDISDKGVLLRVARRIEGLDAAAVEAAWDDGAMEERLHGFRHVALRLGIDSTPAALVCNELLIGSRPYEVLKSAVDECLLTPEGLGGPS